MPRGGYDCTGAAPGSFASRIGRQMYPCGGGNTPRASQAAVFPGAAALPGGYQPSAAVSYQAQQAPGVAYGYRSVAGAAPPPYGFIPQQQQQAAGYAARPVGFAPLQQQAQIQHAFPTNYGYAAAPQIAQQPGVVYGGAYHYSQQPSAYGASQGPYYRGL